MYEEVDVSGGDSTDLVVREDAECVVLRRAALEVCACAARVAAGRRGVLDEAVACEGGTQPILNNLRYNTTPTLSLRVM